MMLQIGKGNQKESQLSSNGLTSSKIISTEQSICYRQKFLIRLLHNRFSNKLAFTFIELILVTLIILIFAGLSSPLFRRPFTNIQLKSTSQHLVQLMRRLQAKAVAERQFCRLNFDFTKNIFWPSVKIDNSGGVSFAEIKEKWGKPFRVPQGLSISSIDKDITFITFYPDGSTDQAEIKISDNKGRVFTVSTQKHIGYIKVEE